MRIQMFLALPVLLLGISAQAKGLDDLAKRCSEAAQAKLTQKAEAANAVLNPETMEVTSIDSRWSNPYKYVWFSCEAVTASGETIVLTAMTQKPPLGKCF